MTSLNLHSWYFCKKNSFTLDRSKTILVLGDSHTECAINDKILLNSANYSQSAQPYIQSYLMLRSFLQANTQLNIVILYYGCDSLLYNTNNWSIDHFSTYWNLLKGTEIYYLFLKYPTIFFKINFDFHSALSIKNINDLTRFGGYFFLDRQKLNDPEWNKNAIFKSNKISYLQNEYLNKIIILCKENNLKLILLSTPLYNKCNYTNCIQYLLYYKKYYKDVLFLDYSDMKLPDDYYGDVRHLNYKGATYFSQYLLDNVFLKE